MSRSLSFLLAVVLALGLALGLTAGLAALAPAQAQAPTIEDYPDYEPATKCRPRAKPGTTMLGRYLVRHYGGRFGSISRACGGSRSEHTEGRAFDWTNDATTRKGRRIVRAFLRDAFATDARDHTHALARRMGIMYVIWDDRIYSAWNRYEPEPYLSSGCRSRTKCSATLRHRDHVHVSLTRAAGRADLSWYVRRLDRAS